MRLTRIMALGALLSCSWFFSLESCKPHGEAPASTASPSEGFTAFRSASAVLLHPRCLHCHAKDDAPLQGEDHHVHEMNVKRAADGRGSPAMRCTNCHQTENSPLPHSPPGADDWHMPPDDMRMSWHGLTVAQLCESLKDPARNGHRKLEDVIDHLDTGLVKWAWEPGPGRERPPLGYDDFITKMRTWKEAGAPCAER